MVAALWWNYFDLGGAAGKQRLVADGEDQESGVADAYICGHFPLTLGLTVVAVGIEQFIGRCYARHVGEFGLGTNPGIGDFIAYNSHINERRCGLHLGFGQHNQSLKRVSYVADVHLDLITRGALVWVDDDAEPIDLTRVGPTGVAHPADVLDKDITTDCCGIGLGQLRSLSCPTPE